MKRPLAGLTIYLLISLLLMAVADGVERGHLHLSASLGLTVGRLWNGEWAFAATWSDRGPLFRFRAGEAGWEFTFDKWQWRSTHRQLGRVRLDSSGKFLRQDADTYISEYRFLRSCQFQGAVRPPG
jgi:hypothetical protein